MGSYKFNESLPIVLNAGLFNVSGQNKPENDYTTNYSFRAVVNPIPSLDFSGNYYSGNDLGIESKILLNFVLIIKLATCLFLVNTDKKLLALQVRM